MQHCPVHNSVVIGHCFALTNPDGFAGWFGGVIVAVCDDWDGGREGTVVPEDALVVCCTYVGTGVSLAFGQDADVSEFSRWVAVVGFADLGRQIDIWVVKWAGVVVQNTRFIVEWD